MKNSRFTLGDRVEVLSTQATRELDRDVIGEWGDVTNISPTIITVNFDNGKRGNFYYEDLIIL